MQGRIRKVPLYQLKTLRLFSLIFIKMLMFLPPFRRFRWVKRLKMLSPQGMKFIR